MSYDVIILGGGLVGLTTALLCAKQKLSVAVVDRLLPILEWSNDDYDLRCSAISPRSQRLFESMGVWELMGRISPFDQMKTWDAEGYGEISFQASDVFELNLGHIIENRVMLKALWTALKQQSQVETLENTVPLSFSIDNQYIKLQLSNHQTLSGKVLVGADGADSWLRKLSGFKTIGQDYRQKALVTVVKTELPHEKTAWQRFLKEGPLAFLPLSDPSLSSIVWTTTPSQADHLLSLSETDFCEALAFAFDYRLGKIMSTQKRQSFDLKWQKAVRVVDERRVLIGDAAQVIHPLAGQGVNLGLQDANVLSEVLSQAKAEENDLGHYLVLRRYERARKGQAWMTLGAMNFLNRFFSMSHSTISMIRSAGVNRVDQSQLLKKEIMRQAMGIDRHSPLR